MIDDGSILSFNIGRTGEEGKVMSTFQIIGKFQRRPLHRTISIIVADKYIQQSKIEHN